ncbi:unnamed protein product [Staurois parvus]|uniref:Uncharacterized protein n=1 Tax=Staurois parvus TaxID=386267 RepID=A0ABN9AQZ4_9NEOB|nr:unnamed protein product [Staurois parvus]
MQSDKYRSPGNCQTQTNVHRIARQRSVIHHSREHVSTALVFTGGVLSCCCSQLLLLCYNITNS